MSRSRDIGRRWLRRLGFALCFAGIIAVGVIAINALRDGSLGNWFGQKNSAEEFTLYAPAGSRPAFSRTDKAALAVTVAPDIMIYESRVLPEQEATIAPPYACELHMLQQYMRGVVHKDATVNPPSQTEVSECGKVGYAKDSKPVYQQYIRNGDDFVYYYTRLGVTHIVVTVPLDGAADPNRQALQEVLAAINSLQPVHSDDVSAAP